MSTTQPIRAAKVRSGDEFICDGTNAVKRWDGVSASAWDAGITAPTGAPTVTASSGTSRTITGAAAHGTLIQLTTSASNIFSTGDMVFVTGVTGTTEANGVWPVTKIDATHYDLQGSQFVTAYVSGGTAILLGATLGSYSFAYRYTDSTTATDKFPDGVPSNLSPLATVVASWGDTFSWTFTANGLTRAGYTELWRTTSGQTAVYYLVARVSAATTTYADNTLNDNTLTTQTPNSVTALAYPYNTMAYLQPDGSVNAMRFVAPPSDAPYMMVLQDRLVYAGRPGQHRNQIGFSESDEPESCPADNIITVQENTGDDDEVTGLTRHGVQGYLLKERHLYAIQWIKQPEIDGSCFLVADRGAVSDRCVTWFEGKAYILDTAGIYSFDGRSCTPISQPIQDIFRDTTIDWANRKWFWASNDPARRILYFFVGFSADSSTRPKKALVYHVDTGVWDLDLYTVEMGGGALYKLSGKSQLFIASTTVYLTGSGLTDAGAAIPWKHKSGQLEYPVSDSKSKRSFTLSYKPTVNASGSVTLNIFRGYSTTAEVINTAQNLGTGITTAAGTANITLDISLARSGLGNDPGYKEFIYQGTAQDRSQADRYVAFQINGSQSADQITIYDYEIQGSDQ